MVNSRIFSIFAPQFNKTKRFLLVKKWYLIGLITMMVCLGCQWQMRSSGDSSESEEMTIERYDRVESDYLTMADYAALRQMNTDYPTETRMLIEDVLQLGRVDDPDINTRLLVFFQDTTLQTLLSDIRREYANMDDVNRELRASFNRLHAMLPHLELPRVYTQIGSLDQSIIVGDGMLGISLDKYLGSDHPLYYRYGYTERQRTMMSRQYIVPDCVAFYLLSSYPSADTLSHEQQLHHMGCIQYVTNKAVGRNVFNNEHVRGVAEEMNNGKYSSIDELLNSSRY